uniref:Uncharacterized protein n=1 Tax=Anguilla anguilla TaxID=7936 RepID=A0A0E9RGG8_ANGAN
MFNTLSNGGLPTGCLPPLYLTLWAGQRAGEGACLFIVASIPSSWLIFTPL